MRDMSTRVVLLAIAALLLVPTASSQPSVTAGSAIELAFAPGAPAVATFACKAGDYARVEIVPSGGAQAVARTSDGRFLRNGSKPDDAGPLVVEIVASAQETIVVEVSAARGNESGGSARISLAALRPATEDQRIAIGADMALDDGDRLMSDGSAEALREALGRFETASDLYARAGNTKMLGTALDSTGWVHDLLGEKRKAIEVYKSALEARRKAGDQEGEIFTLLGIGLVYNYLGETDKALETNEHALVLARDTGSKRHEANLLHNIGGLYWSIDEMQTALDYYNRSLEVRKPLDDKVGTAGTLNNIGDVYRRLGDFDRAMEYFQSALAMRTELGNKRGMAHSLHTMGLVHASRGDWETARDTFQRGLDLRRETGDKRGVAFSLSGLSGAWYELGEVDKAIALSDEAIALWEEMGEVRSHGESKWRRGLMLIDIGRLDDAKTSLDAALEIARKVRDRTSEASALYGIARYQRKKDDLDAALARIEEAIGIVESLRGKIASEELRASYLASVSKFYDFYVSLQMEMDRKRPGSGFAARALESSERARARSLLDSLAAASVETRLEPGSEIAEREAQLRRQVQHLDRQVVKLAAEETQTTELALAQTELDRSLAEYQKVLDEIRATHPRLSDLMRPATLSVGEIQSILDPGTALLEFALGQEESFVWAVTKDGLATAFLPKRAEIDERARSLYEALAARNEAPEGETAAARRARIAAADVAWAEKAPELARILLSGIASSIEGRRLVVVADGALQYLPFGALPDPGSDSGEPLLARHELIALPSASILPLLRREERRTKAAGAPEVAIVADPVFRSDDSRVERSADASSGEITGEDPNQLLLRSAAEAGLASFPRLRFSRREAEAIRSFLEPEMVSEAVDFAASLESIDWAAFGSSRILHLATHGILNSRSPELSGLVLSLVDRNGRPQPGFLKLGDVYGMRLASDLVVLSACQTALGKEIRGEGLVGLTRGFMYAGAPRVISSLWRVDDRATAELMKRFYRNLLEKKMPPAAALRDAQLDLRSEERWSVPYYWSAFTIQGDWK